MFQAEGQSGAKRVRWTPHSSPDEAQGIRCGWRRGRDAEGDKRGGQRLRGRGSGFPDRAFRPL